MLTINDVARIFDVPPETIKQWCEKGQIKTFKTGSHSDPLFRHEDVAIAYLDRSIQKSLDY